MGAEAFGISMRFVEVGVYQQVVDMLARYGDICMDCTQTLSDFEVITGEYSDRLHFIEFQLSREMKNDQCTLAVRFSLCSYPTIDAIFLDVVDKILATLDADVWLMTSALKQKNNFPPGESKWLMVILPEEIVAMRTHWQTIFGTKQGAVRVKDSFLFVGQLNK